jgi:hypothetical protein
MGNDDHLLAQQISESREFYGSEIIFSLASVERKGDKDATKSEFCGGQFARLGFQFCSRRRKLCADESRPTTVVAYDGESEIRKAADWHLSKGNKDATKPEFRGGQFARLRIALCSRRRKLCAEESRPTMVATQDSESEINDSAGRHVLLEGRQRIESESLGGFDGRLRMQ